MAESKAALAHVTPHKHELTHIIAPFLDKHMLVPYLQFLNEKHIYDEKDVRKALLDLYNTTRMVDVAEEEYKSLHNTQNAPQEFAERRNRVFAEMASLKASCEPLSGIFTDQEGVKELRASNNLTFDYFRETHKITEDTLDNLYKFAKFSFECGLYRDASDCLNGFRALSRNPEKRFSAQWGILAAEILMNNLKTAEDVLTAMLEEINERKGQFYTPETLQQRTWLLHWSLFIHFFTEDGRIAFVDLVLNSDHRLLNVIHATSPHILRYLTVALISSKASHRKKNYLKDLVKAIRQEADTYSDPILEFLTEVLVEFNFEAAQKKLKECEQVVNSDFFFAVVGNEFVENARLLMFETLARIHKSIDINLLSSLLEIPEDQREAKIVDLIRVTRMDAKLDSTKNQLVMGAHFPTVYQHVIDKTRSTAHRTTQLFNLVERKATQLQQEAEDI